MTDRPGVSRAVTTSAPEPSERTAPDPPPSRPSPQRGTLRPLLLRLHFYAGLLVAPLLLVAAVTGLLYAFTPQLERALYDELLAVDDAPATLPLTQQVQAARAAHPEGAIASVRPAATGTDSTRVNLSVEDLTGDELRTVFVNPHDGAVLGTATTTFDALPVKAWLSGLHRNLQLGEPGRVYSELAASWLWLIALGGLALWAGRRRTLRRQAAARPAAAGDASPAARRSLRRRPSPTPRTPRRRLLRVHTAVGLIAVLGLVMLSATGLTWSSRAGGNIGDLRAQLDWTTPAVDTGDAGGGEHAGHGGHGGMAGGGDHSGREAERVLALDRVAGAAAATGLRGPLEIAVPAGDDDRFAVTENHRVWPVRQDAAAVAGATGAVTDVVRFDDWPLAAQLSSLGVALHMGTLFGLPNQLALAALALGLIALIVLGYRMWFARRPTRGRSPGGRPFPRGAWRHVRPAVLAAIVAATVLVGWALPLLGLSLLAFVLVDVALGARRRRVSVRAHRGR